MTGGRLGAENSRGNGVSTEAKPGLAGSGDMSPV